MQPQLAYLLYVSANETEAQILHQTLADKGLEFLANPAAYTLDAALSSNPDTPIILLLSDSLLRSFDLISQLQVFMEQIPQGLLALRCPGRNENGELLTTEISNIHEVTRYRDFWYDEWIGLRRRGNQLEETDPNLEEQKNMAKAMSTHIHTFLRKLNQFNPPTWEEAQAQNFRPLFEKMQRLDLWQPDTELVALVQPIALHPEEQKTENQDLQTESIETETFVETVLESETKTEAEPEPQIEEKTAVELQKTSDKTAFVLDLLQLPSDFDPQEIFESIELKQLQDLDALFFIAETETEEGEYLQAVQCYERILQLDPTNGRALLWLARLYARHLSGQEAQADAYYRRALLFAEPQGQLFYEYALLQGLHLGQARRAVELLYDALDLEPQRGDYHLLLAQCRLSLGQETEARAAYLQACLLNPDLHSSELEQQLHILRPEAQETPLVQAEAEAKEQAQTPPNKGIVLVSGASSGIGQAIAERFALDGYKVIVTGRRAERLEAFKTALESRFEVDMHCLPFDVRNPEEVAQALQSLPNEWQHIDILVNNAGLAKGLAPIQEGKLDDWETMIDTNLKGLLYLSRLVSQNMVKRRKGHILHIGSIAGKEAYPMGNVYCATKAAVDMLTKGMRIDLAPHNVRVSAIHPGHVETEFALVRFDQDAEKADIYRDFTPLQAQDVADLVHFVATRPAHVNIQDALIFSTQQASARDITRSGKMF